MISGRDIDALQRLCDAASKGTWVADHEFAEVSDGKHTGFSVTVQEAFLGQGRHDAALIAASRTALPEALEEIRRLMDEVVALRADSELHDETVSGYAAECAALEDQIKASESEWPTKLATLESEILRLQNDIGLRNARECVLYKWIANLIAAKRESEAARSAEILALQHDVTRLLEIQVEEQSEWSAKVEALEVEIARAIKDDGYWNASGSLQERIDRAKVGSLRRALEIMTGGPQS